MMARHAEVSQNAVQALHAIIAHPVLQISEIAPHEGEAPVGNGIGRRVCILVKTVQVALRRQPGHNLPTMAASAERGVHVHSGRVGHQTVHARLEQDGHMINSLFHQRLHFT